MTNVTALPIHPSKSRKGRIAYSRGLAAEFSVERHYNALGCTTSAKRWRGAGAEIDLIFREGDRLVFVEVKAGPTFDAAAQRVAWPQIHRIMRAAEAYAGKEMSGEMPEMRIDVALVDVTGAVEVLENVSMAA
ncbi:YraN family protein [Pseudooceanicola algae]|uniref:Uncharacterized protein n=1 Tax=Pseudooceanicola algae TaxID=1537215 RepID=A0A418SGY3_9RHOB|nr:YraN family protein [Pseudooceanicola algae]QPM88870.1 hypothetical protein PSAL_000730 [Pseudooceanicola algae]